MNNLYSRHIEKTLIGLIENKWSTSEQSYSFNDFLPIRFNMFWVLKRTIPLRWFF